MTNGILSVYDAIPYAMINQSKNHHLLIRVADYTFERENVGAAVFKHKQIGIVAWLKALVTRNKMSCGGFTTCEECQ